MGGVYEPGPARLLDGGDGEGLGVVAEGACLVEVLVAGHRERDGAVGEAWR